MTVQGHIYAGNDYEKKRLCGEIMPIVRRRRGNAWWQRGNEMKWNESGFRPPLCTYRLNWTRRTTWGWWDDWDDTVLQTGFEIQSPAVWGRARYLSVTEAPHDTDFHTWMGKKHLCFFQTAETGNRTPNSGVKGSGANHYPRAPALWQRGSICHDKKCLRGDRENLLINYIYYKLFWQLIVNRETSRMTRKCIMIKGQR